MRLESRMERMLQLLLAKDGQPLHPSLDMPQERITPLVTDPEDLLRAIQAVEANPSVHPAILRMILLAKVLLIQERKSRSYAA